MIQFRCPLYFYPSAANQLRGLLKSIGDTIPDNWEARIHQYRSEWLAEHLFYRSAISSNEPVFHVAKIPNDDDKMCFSLVLASDDHMQNHNLLSHLRDQVLRMECIEPDRAHNNIAVSRVYLRPIGQGAPSLHSATVQINFTPQNRNQADNGLYSFLDFVSKLPAEERQPRDLSE